MVLRCMIAAACLLLQDAKAYVEHKFPQGTRLTIIEPFYKIAGDGYFSVRVDDPADVIIHPSQENLPAEGSQQGNSLAAAIEHSKHTFLEGALLMNMNFLHVCNVEESLFLRASFYRV